MGAKKKRQEEDSWEQRPPSGSSAGNPGDPGSGSTPGGSGLEEVRRNSTPSQCSSCCNTSYSSYTDENNNVIEVKPGEELNCGRRDKEKGEEVDKKSTEGGENGTTHKTSKSFLSQAWRKLLGSGKKRKTQSASNVLVLGLLVIVASSSLIYRPVHSVCVWQGGGGFKVACGFRQSGLFRIRSIGGIKGYIGGGFTIGDEKGFADSLTNMEPQQQSGPYVIPNNANTRRSLPTGPFVGEYTAIQEHVVPPPSGDPQVHQQQKMQYLNNIQTQLDTDHTELQLQAQDQQSQKQLEQQMYIQGGIIPPAPTAKVKRAETGGLTKRASLWNWNIFGRGKSGNGGKNGKKKPNKNNGHSSPPQNRRMGPPPPPPRSGGKQNHGGNNGRWDRRGKNKPPPPPPPRNKQRGGPPPPPPPPHQKGGGGKIRGMSFPKSRKDLKNMAENFLGHMKNPFAHLQENFVGKMNQKDANKVSNFHQEKNSNFPLIAQRKNFQFQPQQLPQQRQNHDNGPAFPSFAQGMFPPLSMDSMRQVPQQAMLPPPPSSSYSGDIPQFKKLPEMEKPAQNRNDDYLEEEDGPPGGMDEHEEQREEQQKQQQRHQQPSLIRKMMAGTNSHEDYPQEPPPPHEFYKISASNEFPILQENDGDPAGLKMLKNTQNFGTIFHLVNPDGSPVNMQFEKEPIIPPGVEHSPQKQQELLEAYANAGFDYPQQEINQQLPPPKVAVAGVADILGLAGMGMDSPLATAVYDPNVFPDIYFTTTEKHKNVLPSHVSQELLDTHHALINGNHLKRILGSSEKSGKVSGGGSSTSNSNNVRDEFVKQVAAADQEKSGAILRSDEVSTKDTDTDAGNDNEQEQQIVLVPVPTRRKVRRRKKLRQQINNQIDTNESDGQDASSSTPASQPKRRRKGRRKKKYKLATTERQKEAEQQTSTERIGRVKLDGGEQTSTENSNGVTETSIRPLTTTQAPEAQELRRGPKRNKTSFSLPSNENYYNGYSLENRVDTSAQSSTTTRTSSTEDPTTNTPFSYSTFGYIDALRNRKGNPDDYDFSGPSGPEDFFSYDPRYPPDHEVNRGRNMTKFIRPRGPNATPTSASIPETTDMPFILYDMVGTRNQSRFSSKFHKDVSPFKLDGDLDQDRRGNSNHNDDLQRMGDYPYGNGESHNNGNQYHPFYANRNLNGQQSDKGVYLKFDSREWANGEHHKHNSYHKDLSSDPFANHYSNNRTSLSSGYYGQGQKEYGPSGELPWHRRFDDGVGSTTSTPVGYGSSENKFFRNPSSGSAERGLFGPTMATFGLPKQTTTTSYGPPGDGSGEKRKLHQNLFGGSSADVSDLGDWASPNFWGNMQTRYSPRTDFEAQNNMRKVNDFSGSNGLKEITPGDLTSPTPLPQPSPAPSQSTVEDLMDDFLAPSNPGGRWGKQRRRKQRPSTTAAPSTTPSPTAVPLVMSTAIVTSIPASPSTTSVASHKWLAISSNEVETPQQKYPPRILSESVEADLKRKLLAKGKKNPGVELKFKSGEVRDPEEEGDVEQQQENFNHHPQAANATNKMGVGLHQLGQTQDGVIYDYDINDRGHYQQTVAAHHHNHPAPPALGGRSSELGYYPGASVVGSGIGSSGQGASRNSDLLNVYNQPQGVNQYDPRYPPPPPQHGQQPLQRPTEPPKMFNPSAEDLGPLPTKGLPTHKDNPFKQFEKQDVTANNPVVGFVSTKHEFNDMVNQIQKFVPDEFLKTELKPGSTLSGGVDGHHEYRGKHAGPPPTEHLPEFKTVPTDPPMKNNPASPLDFGPSGFPNNLAEHESRLPGGNLPPRKESHPPPVPQPSHPPPGYPHGAQDGKWDMRPLDNNEVTDLGPHPPRERPNDERHPHPGNGRPPHEMEDMDRPPHYKDGPPRPHLSHIRPAPHRDEHEGHPPHRGPPPSRPPPPPPQHHHREERPSRPPPPPHRDERPMRPPPPPPPHHHREERPSRPPPPPHRDERPMRPPPPPPREHERHHPPPPPPRDHHERHHSPPPPPPPRDHDRHHPPPPPPRDHERHPPHGRHDFPPPPRHHGPPGHHEHDRRPPPHDDRDYPPPRRDDGPRHGPRDGPPHGPPPPPPPPHRGHDPRPSGPPPGPRRDEPHHYDHERHRPPPPPEHDNRGHDNYVEHSKYSRWQEHEGPNRAGPHHHDFGDSPKEHQDLRPLPPPPKSAAPNPFLHKPPPPPPPGKSPHLPPKIPPQMFKPPPPPPPSPASKPNSYYPEGPSKPIVRPAPPHHLPPPSSTRPSPPVSVNMPTRKPAVPMKSLFEDVPPRDYDRKHNSPNNYINHFNDRYDPPASHHGRPQDLPGSNHLRPPPPPPMHPHPDQTGGGSRLPYLPFPVSGGPKFETSVIDLDQDPSPHLLPPTLHPQDAHKLPPGQPTQPVYRPQAHRPSQIAEAKMDEKTKLLDAFETLNKANYDVIQSLAVEKYGPEIIDRVKTKSNMMKPDSNKPPLPLTVQALPIVTSTTQSPQLNLTSVKEETEKLAELLKMINKPQQPSPQPVAAASTMPQPKPKPADPISSLIDKLTHIASTTTTPPPPPTTTRRMPEMPSNPGLLSLTSALNPGPTHDVKSLQAQIAKAIIAKAHQKSQADSAQLPSPSPAPESPLQVLQQLAQSRQSFVASSKNYTASQLDTLKKLIALNSIEQKLNSAAPVTLQPPTTENPLKKLQALFSPKKQEIPSNTISRKMLDSSSSGGLAHQHNSNLLQSLNSPDPTILALKAIALSKAQSVHPQPSISLPQQAKPTEPSSQPIAVDLSAILSPSPPAVEASRKRRLTNVKNAPKSFYPANATQGFEDFNFPLMTEFHCDQQNFFPGLYADTELGCRVFHLCAKTEAGYMMKSFRCPKETVFDQEVLRCNWNLFVDCPKSRNKYHFNKYLSQSFQFLKILGEFSANIQKSDATMTG